MDKIWVEIANKIFEVRTSEGRGRGWSVISFMDVLYGWPLRDRRVQYRGEERCRGEKEPRGGYKETL